MLLACKEEVKPGFPQVKISIHDTNEITFSDSVYFISTDTTVKRITFIPEVKDVQLFYAINNGAFELSQELSLPLYKQDTLVQFYLSKEGLEDSPLKTILFQSHSQEFLKNIELSDNPQDSAKQIPISDKSRGILTLEIFDRWGKRILQRNYFKLSEKLEIQYNLDDKPTGVYYGRLSYGRDRKSFWLVWEE